MNPQRLRQRFAPTGRASIRLNTRQRDLFARSAKTPQNVAHALRNAPVRDGKLSLRVTRPELETLILVAAGAGAANREEERELASLVRYLEGIEDRFETEEDAESPLPSESEAGSESELGFGTGADPEAKS